MVPDEILRQKNEVLAPPQAFSRGAFVVAAYETSSSFLGVISGSIRASDARHEFLPDGFVNAGLTLESVSVYTDCSFNTRRAAIV